MILHRVTWATADDAGNPMEHVSYFVEGDERFVKRLVATLDKDPRSSVHAVETTKVAWTDASDRLLA